MANKIKKSLNLLLCLVILGHSSIYGISEDECNQLSTHTWRNNRCIKTDQQVQNEGAAQACLNTEDPAQCMRDAAVEQASGLNSNHLRERDYGENYLGDGTMQAYRQNAGKKMTTALIGMLGIITYVVSYWFTKGSKTPGCKNTDMKFLFWASIGVLAAEGTAFVTYSTKMNKIQDKFKEAVKLDSESDDFSQGAQSQEYTLAAYNAIIEQEKAFKTATDIRIVGYAAAGAAFAAAGVISGINAVKMSMQNDPTQYICPSVENLQDKVASTGKGTAWQKTWFPMIKAVLGVGGAGLMTKLLSSKTIETPSESFQRIRGAESYSELIALQEESSRLRDREISSPSLKEFTANRQYDFLLSHDFDKLVQLSILEEFFEENKASFKIFLENNLEKTGEATASL